MRTSISKKIAVWLIVFFISFCTLFNFTQIHSNADALPSANGQHTFATYFNLATPSNSASGTDFIIQTDKYNLAMIDEEVYIDDGNVTLEDTVTIKVAPNTGSSTLRSFCLDDIDLGEVVEDGIYSVTIKGYRGTKEIFTTPTYNNGIDGLINHFPLDMAESQNKVIDNFKVIYTKGDGIGFAHWNFTLFNFTISNASTDAPPEVTAPNILSISRLNPADEVTNDSQVVYRVIFDEDVKNVDISDFSLTKTGTAAGTISLISADSGSTRDVTIDNLTGTGTIRLDLNSSGTNILDLAENPINPGGFILGQIYSIDNIKPFVSSITRLSPTSQEIKSQPVKYRVKFNEDITGADKEDFELTTTGTATGTIDSITLIGTQVIDVLVNNINGNGTLRLDLKSSNTNIKDTAGNDIESGFSSGETYTVDTLPPVIIESSQVSTNNEYIDITFSEKIRKSNNGTTLVEGSDFSTNFQQNTGTATGATILGICRTDGGPINGDELTIRFLLDIVGNANGDETIRIGSFFDASAYDMVGNPISALQTGGARNLNVTVVPPIPVTSIVVTAGANEINVKNGTLQMTAEVTPTDATDKTVTWSVTETNGDATTKATIDMNGILTAVQDGQVRVKATSVSNPAVSAVKDITISNNPVVVPPTPVTSIVVTAGAFEINFKNGTLQMTAEVTPTDATDKTVTWSVTEPNGDATTKATIDTNGILTAVQDGQVRVKATSVSNPAVSAVKDITISNNPVVVPPIPVTSIVVTAGAFEINFKNGTLQMTAEVTPTDATDKTVTWSVTEPNGDATTKATIDMNGILTAVQDGQVRVKATSVSNPSVSAVKDITISNNPVVAPPIPINPPSNESSSRESNTGGSNSAISNFNILVNGKFNEAAVVKSTMQGDLKAITVTLNDNILQEKIQTEENNSRIVITVNDFDIVTGELNGLTVKNLEDKDFILEIKTNDVSYTLPAEMININEVLSQMGRNIELRDIKVNIKISNISAEKLKPIQENARIYGYQILVKPIEFEIMCTDGSQKFYVNKFLNYVERMIAIPQDIDPSKITTGVIVNSDGTFSHIPTTIVLLDGKYYAKLNSLTNSMYTVIGNKKTFKDMEAHWASDAVKDLASRLIVSGANENTFVPDEEITRAEFITLVVNSLGIDRKYTGKDIFEDVDKDDWYYDSISTAYDRGLTSGYKDKFNPVEKITREEAMTILSEAMKLVNLDSDIPTETKFKLLEKYTDAKLISAWARDSVAQCINSNIVVGANSKIMPSKNITRAEAVSILRNMLKKAQLIN